MRKRRGLIYEWANVVKGGGQLPMGPRKVDTVPTLCRGIAWSDEQTGALIGSGRVVVQLIDKDNNPITHPETGAEQRIIKAIERMKFIGFIN